MAAVAGGVCFSSVLVLVAFNKERTFSIVWRMLHGHAFKRLAPLRAAAFSMALSPTYKTTTLEGSVEKETALAPPSPPLPPLGPLRTALEIGAGMGDCVPELCAISASASGVPLQRLLLVEPNHHFHAALRRVAETVSAPTEVAVLTCGGEALEAVADSSVDLVFSHLVLCSAPQQPVLAEIRRVLRPGGRLVCVEHVRGPPAAWLQDALTGTGLWGLIGGGCSLTRDTAAAIADAGPWQRLEVRAVNVRDLPFFMRPHIVAVAVR